MRARTNTGSAGRASEARESERSEGEGRRDARRRRGRSVGGSESAHSYRGLTQRVPRTGNKRLSGKFDISMTQVPPAGPNGVVTLTSGLSDLRGKMTGSMLCLSVVEGCVLSMGSELMRRRRATLATGRPAPLAGHRGEALTDGTSEARDLCATAAFQSQLYRKAHAPAATATAAALTRLTPLFDRTSNPLPRTRTTLSSGKAGDGCGEWTTRLRLVE